MSKKNLIILGIFGIFLLSGLFSAADAQAATVSLEAKTATQGQLGVAVPIKINCSKKEKISDITMEITFDNTKLAFKKLTAGKIVTEAHKMVQSSLYGVNKIRLLVVGINNNIISQGELARIEFDVLNNAPAGKVVLYIDKATASNPQAHKVLLQYQSKKIDGSFTIKRRPK